jgi:1-deoxy-D-xylulose-5-phosphate reductoisomerase
MFPDKFSVKSLAAGANVKLLADQIEMFSPELAVVVDERRAVELKKILPPKTRVEIMSGEEGYRTAATLGSVDTVVSAMMGAAGLSPTLAAIEAGKNIALANKESIVMAGEIIVKKTDEKGINIVPIDSEHSAIFQCISGQRKEDVTGIFLTGSGGPFLNLPAGEFKGIKPADALAHPTWHMGRKISVDSATLMNKGLEVIEAEFFFRVPLNIIKVIIQPQSIIHSMVSFRDGTIIAQLGIPDMKGAIAYSISYPERLPLGQPIPDFINMGPLTFSDPDLNRFPCLSLAYEAGREGGTLPAVLNASNEIAVQAFLNNRIDFVKIPEIISNTMEFHSTVKNPDLSDIMEADTWAREYAENNIIGRNCS